MKPTVLVAAGAMALLALTACSSTTETTSPSSTSTTTASGTTPPGSTTGTSAKQPVCEARAGLRTSVAELTKPSVLTSGEAAIQTALDDVETNLDEVADTAEDVYRPQVDDVKAAVGDLKTAVNDLGDGNATDNLQAVGSAITEVGSTAATLDSTLQSVCP